MQWFTRHSLLETYFSQFYLVTLYQRIFFDMHLDRPSIHKEGPWSIAIFHQGPHPIASISRPWEKWPWWIPSHCRYAKRGPKLAPRWTTGWTPGAQVLSLQVKRGRGELLHWPIFFVWKWRQQKFQEVHMLVLLVLPKVESRVASGNLFHDSRLTLTTKMVGFGWEMVKWTIGNLGFFWRSFSLQQVKLPASKVTFWINC